MNNAEEELRGVLQDVRPCRVCEEHLPLGPRPVLRADLRARVLIVGQAPGTRVHETGIPWNDPSGDRLRGWLGIDRATFYDESRFAIIPTGLPEFLPLPHPSPRNTRWLQVNPWFVRDVIAVLPERMHALVQRFSAIAGP